MSGMDAIPAEVGNHFRANGCKNADLDIASLDIFTITLMTPPGMRTLAKAMQKQTFLLHHKDMFNNQLNINLSMNSLCHKSVSNVANATLASLEYGPFFSFVFKVLFHSLYPAFSASSPQYPKATT